MVWRVAIEGMTVPFSNREKKAGDKFVSSASFLGVKPTSVRSVFKLSPILLARSAFFLLHLVGLGESLVDGNRSD